MRYTTKLPNVVAYCGQVDAIEDLGPGRDGALRVLARVVNPSDHPKFTVVAPVRGHGKIAQVLRAAFETGDVVHITGRLTMAQAERPELQVIAVTVAPLADTMFALLDDEDGGVIATRGGTDG